MDDILKSSIRATSYVVLNIDSNSLYMLIYNSYGYKLEENNFQFLSKETFYLCLQSR